MILDRVTVTGADDSIDPEQLIQLTMRFPFVEWGILLSRSQEGGPRFPSTAWIERLKLVADTVNKMQGPMRLSGHLCGQWVRALCRGSNRFRAERPTIADMFQRVQLNFHGDLHDVDEDFLPVVLRDWGREEYILQFDDVNNLIIGALWMRGIKAVPLFDRSGGAGREPDEWPSPVAHYCGYAGGLRPDEVARQYRRIELAAGPSRVWTDIETHVFSEDGRKFDLAKVEQYLSAAELWVHRG
jgi:hypothetical protein